MDDEIRYQASVDVPGNYGLHGLVITSKYLANAARSCQIKVDANDDGLATLENLVAQIHKQRAQRASELRDEIKNDLGEISASFNNYLVPKVQALTSKIHESNTVGVTGVRYSRPAEDVRYFMKLLNELRNALDTLTDLPGTPA